MMNVNRKVVYFYAVLLLMFGASLLGAISGVFFLTHVSVYLGLFLLIWTLGALLTGFFKVVKLKFRFYQVLMTVDMIFAALVAWGVFSDLFYADAAITGLTTAILTVFAMPVIAAIWVYCMVKWMKHEREE